MVRSSGEVEESLQGRADANEIDLVSEVVQIVDERDQLTRSGAVEKTDLAEVDADAPLLDVLNGLGLASEGLSAVPVEITLDLQNQSIAG
jgi:hypothetical protein